MELHAGHYVPLAEDFHTQIDRCAVDIRIEAQVNLQIDRLTGGIHRGQDGRKRVSVVAQHLVGFEFVRRSLESPHYQRVGSHQAGGISSHSQRCLYRTGSISDQVFHLGFQRKRTLSDHRHTAHEEHAARTPGRQFCDRSVNVDFPPSGPNSCPLGISHESGNARTSLIGTRGVVGLKPQGRERRFHGDQALQRGVRIVGPVRELHRTAAARDAGGSAPVGGGRGQGKGLPEIGLMVGNALRGRPVPAVRIEPDETGIVKGMAKPPAGAASAVLGAGAATAAPMAEAAPCPRPAESPWPLAVPDLGPAAPKRLRFWKPVP